MCGSKTPPQDIEVSETDQDKGKEELLREINELRRRISEMENIQVGHAATEQAHRESEERLRLFSIAPFEAIFLSDKGVCIGQNLTAEKMFGYSAEEALTRSIPDWVVPEYRKLTREHIMAGYEEPYEAVALRKDGTTFPCEILGKSLNFQGGLVRVTCLRDITEGKKAQEALRNTQSELQAIYDYAPIMMCVLDGRRQVLYANRAFADFVGKNESELREGRACGVFGCINALDDPRGCGYGPHCASCALRLAIEDTYNTGRGHRAVEFRSTLIVSDLHREVVLLGSTAHIQADDRSSVLLCLEDMTDRERVERALRESEERYRDFFETSRDCVFITTLDGKFVDVNDAALELFGYEPQDKPEFLRKEVSSIYANPGERAAHVKVVLQLGFSKEFPVEMRRLDGTIAHVLITTVARKDPHGAIIGFQGTLRDITAQKLAEEALRTTLQRFYTILSSLYAGVLIVTKEGRVEFVNQAFCDLFDLGDPPEALRGLASPDMVARISGAYAQPAEAVARIKEVVAQNLPIRGEPIAMRGGRTYMVDYVPLIIDGKDSGRLWHHNNITDLKRAEEERARLRDQLLQAQKMESIGTLTGGIAHDFNNLLTVMNGYTELILAETKEDTPLYADLQKILVTGRKGADMVQRLLAFSQKAEIRPQTLDLNGIVETSVKLMKRTFPKIIEIETVQESELSMVNADAVQIEQVLVNLCINAKEAMPEGGTLRIESKNLILSEADCGVRVGARPGRHVLLEVSDTGAGMDKETMERIFDPFFTTKGWDFNKGTGLGLSVAKGIVEQHGGWITCQSEPGKGTSFTIYFPSLEDSPAVQQPRPQVEIVPGTEKILLVDDEELVRKLGKRILERAGYAVITASDGKEALTIYAREQSTIGLVILDLIMPHLGGERCLEELLKINPNIRVVVSSGHSLGRKDLDSLSAYAKGFVNKPYQINQFLQVVRTSLDAE